MFRMSDVIAVREFCDLPVFSEIDDPHFGEDLAATAQDLFSRPYQGLMRTSAGGYTDGSAFVYRNGDLKALVACPELGNQPIEAYACPYSAHSEVEPNGFHQLMVNNLFTKQPPDHNPAKQLVSKRLTTNSVARFAEPMTVLAHELVDRAATGATIDFRQMVADPMMTGFWQVALGWTESEANEICGLAADSQLSNLLNPNAAQRRKIDAASLELLQRASGAIARELDSGNQQLLNELADDYAAMAPDSPGRPDVLADLFGASLLDGLHSLGAVIASVVHGILEAPGILAALRRDPDLVGSAFLEAIRLHPAVTFTQRSALKDLSIAGVLVPRGTPVTMAWSMGNRDPSVFPEPNVFRLDRTSRAQTTFGGGFYICPGRNLVRFLCEIVLRELATASIELKPAGRAEWVAGTALHELRTMPVSIRRT